MKKFLGIVVLGLILNGCAAMEGSVTRGMHKQDYCGAKNLGAIEAICNKRYIYYKDGIEVLNKGNTYAVFKDVSDPTTSTRSSNHYGNGTFVAEVYSWEAAQDLINNLSEKNIATNQVEIASMIEKAKGTCKSLGFNEGTEKFTDCSLKLYSQSLDLATKQNQQVVVQNQGNSSDTIKVFDVVRDRENTMRKAKGLIDGSCTLANYVFC